MSEFLAKAMRYLRPVMLVTAVALLVVILARLGVRRFVELAGNLSPWWLVATLLTIIVNFAFAARRYQMLAAPELSFLRVLDTIMVSFLLNYASMIQGLGIGAKVGMLKMDGVRASRSLAGIVGEIMFDLLFAVAVGVAFWFTADDPAALLQGLPAVPVAVLVVALLVLALLAALSLRYSQFLREVWQQLGAIVRSGRLAEVVLATTGIWVAAGLGFYCMLHALPGDSPAGLFLCIFAITTGFITGLVSMIPGGIGIREVTWAYVVSLSGVSIEEAGLIAVLYRALSIAAIVVVVAAWRQLLRLMPAAKP